MGDTRSPMRDPEASGDQGCPMRDPEASMERRAWASCTRCADHVGCADCEAGRSCERHWRFLLHAEGRYLFLQCPTCAHRWWQDTRFGVGGRPSGTMDLPHWPDDETGVA
ncbi:MAG: hypothetical protein ACR2G2_12145 [Pseudonocardia sp.]